MVRTSASLTTSAGNRGMMPRGFRTCWVNASAVSRVLARDGPTPPRPLAPWQPRHPRRMYRSAPPGAAVGWASAVAGHAITATARAMKRLSPRSPMGLPHVFAEELQRALAGQARAGLVEGRPLVAAEAVASRIDVHRQRGLGGSDAIPVLLGDRGVGLAEVQQDGTARRLLGEVRDSSAVVADGGADAVHAGGGQPGHRAAHAVADHAELQLLALQ